MQPVKPSILCTGPVDLSLLNPGDVTIDIINFTMITTILPDDIQREIQTMLKEKAVVVFTSGNAILPVVNCIGDQRPDWAVYCIGNTTHELAKKHFGAGAIRQTASSAALLAEKIIEEKNIKALVFFCGNLRRDDLPELLRRNNIGVKEIIVYQTSPVSISIEKEYDAILFFSPGAVESFFSNNSVASKTALFAIGNTTAGKIKEFSNNPVIIADEPDKILLINKAINSLVSPLA